MDTPEVLKEQFKGYLSTCVKSARRTADSFFITDNAVGGYLKYLNQLFDYNPEKWKHIKNIYSINKSSEALELFNQLLADPDFESHDRADATWRSGALMYYVCFLRAKEFFSMPTRYQSSTTVVNYDKYLNALRTKPFLLLAGISGTGKSRIVRELAYKSCPNVDDLRSDNTTPGNYLMVAVKPNWHDSSELLGYYSNISKKYVITPFIKFLIKAKKYPNVPFFVCLDEMNLAPVEQYFAEFLSVLETRRLTTNGIKSGVLIESKFLGELGETEDLTLPNNVFIVGTVNMDDTTHQFSRKVIDRAMTIEMNGGNLENMFGHSSDLDYPDEVWSMEKELLTQYVSADEVLSAYPDWAEKIKSDLPVRLENYNKCMKNTPFEVSYRVLNELVIYLGVLLDNEKNIDDNKFDILVNTALDKILLMKILPRIEGDAEMFALSKEEREEIGENSINNKLEWLKSVCPNILGTDDSLTAKNKLDEMINRLDSGFTRFWP